MKRLIVLLSILMTFFYTPLSFAQVATDSADILPTDTPTPTDVTDTPTPDTIINATDSGEVNNTVFQTANTGENSILPATDSAVITSPSANISTGDSMTTVSLENSINTSKQNSEIIYQTINIYVDSSNNIDLSQPIQLAQQTAEGNLNPSTNIVLSNNQNFAFIETSVDASSDTGGNSASSNNQATINTGNAYTQVQLTNTVNVTLVDTVIHIVTINIYGNMYGNILLPDSPTGTCTTANANISNAATVNSSVSVFSNTGTNTAISSQSGTIITGDSENKISIQNFLNLLFLNMYFNSLSINTFGTWDGKFLGWGSITSSQDNNNLTVNNIQGLSGNTSSNSSELNISNTAVINNNINISANTGNNKAYANNTYIKTGNAYTFTDIINFINTVFVNSKGFLGFINIFGSFHGDIGEKSLFITPTPTPSSSIPIQTKVSDTQINKNLEQITPTITPKITNFVSQTVFTANIPTSADSSIPKTYSVLGLSTQIPTIKINLLAVFLEIVFALILLRIFFARKSIKKFLSSKIKFS